MRISDWSSDVCSSDLSSRAGLDGFVGGSLAYVIAAGVFRCASSRSKIAESSSASNLRANRSGLSVRRRASAVEKVDRKCERWGKRVSVCVEIGGSRIIQKKNSYNTDTFHRFLIT